MSVIREIAQAVREGLDDLLNAGSAQDEIDELTGLLESDLAEAQAELGVARQDAERLAARLRDEQLVADRLHEQAKAAVDAGDDEGGRELIRRRRRALRGVEILQQQAAEHEQLTGQLREHIDALEDRLQEVHLRRDYLRTRNRVRALQERYERYEREFELGEPQVDDELDLSAEAAEPTDEPLVPRRRRERLTPEAEPEPAPLSRAGRAELPATADGDSGLRAAADEEFEAPPPRSLRVERERLLEAIERRSPTFDHEIEDELSRLKAASGRPEPDATPPTDGPADAPAPDA